MKKIYLSMALVLSLFCVGCGRKETVADVMSEQTEIYFYGEGEAGSASIAVGKRENPYVMDGKHGQMCDFSLITLNLDSEERADEIDVCVEIGERKEEIILQLNPLNMSYMGDLGYVIDGEENVNIVLLDGEIVLKNISEEFAVDYQSAIQIGYSHIEDASRFQKGDDFICEGYLKIIDAKYFGGEGLRWCFTLLSEGQSSCNILIDVYDENVVFKG